MSEFIRDRFGRKKRLTGTVIQRNSVDNFDRLNNLLGEDLLGMAMQLGITPKIASRPNSTSLLNDFVEAVEATQFKINFEQKQKLKLRINRKSNAPKVGDRDAIKFLKRFYEENGPFTPAQVAHLLRLGSESGARYRLEQLESLGLLERNQKRHKLGNSHITYRPV